MKNKYNEIIKGLSDREILFHLYMTQIILLILTIVLGFLFFDQFSFMKAIDISDRRILLIGVPAGVAVVVLDVLLMKWLPSSYYDDGGLNERIFKNKSVLHIACIAALVAVSEELLFRGVIQTKVGLILASIIFAIIHYRYLFNWFLFTNIVTLSFFIGYMYEWSNNLVLTIVMHFIIDFLLGLYIRYKHSKEIDGQEGLFHE
ncbi:CPBP family intramembrane glutamic endopeptidase [Neobacillus niacini]|uniref:CPBP family intramembrane glutamic endopeptidase n=1 Tax=Neobacillus niacini TaxID=86668 RepID=UPI003982DC76